MSDVTRPAATNGTDSGLGDVDLAGAAGFAPAPREAVPALFAAGVSLGIIGDVLLRAPEDLALNMSLWIAAVAAGAVVVHRRVGLALDPGRMMWLGVGVAFGATFAWRDAVPLKLLAMGSAILTFAIAAHRPVASWVRGSGIVRYGVALALGALHTWLAAGLALLDGARWTSRPGATRAVGWRRAAAVARGLLIAVPLVAVFGALLMSADALFENMVLDIVDIDIETVLSHVVMFCVAAWLSTGYVRGFLTGTEPPVLRAFGGDNGPTPLPFRRPTLGLTEIATVLTALDVLFLAFVVVQFRYLFGGDVLVQITPDLTYADYARRGFFELVFAVFLIVPVLLAADWLLDRGSARATPVFRALAGAQIGLMLLIAVSALERLRLYYDNYGLTDSRLYAAVLLVWIAAMLLWFVATALRGRRQAFAFGALTSGLATVGLLVAANPDAIIARTNVARVVEAGAPARFDVAYATSLSGDAIPVLVGALPNLAPDVQCRLARNILRRWPPDRERSIRIWNWSASRAASAVRAHEAALRAMSGADPQCGASGAPAA